MTTKETYCLCLVTDFLVNNNFTFKYKSPKTGVIEETGVIVKLVNEFSISIQTHPLITGQAFSETSLLLGDKTIYTDNWYYYDLRKQYTPKELFDHLKELHSILQDYESIENGIKLKNGNTITFLNSIQ
jgi:hypothetical protein